MEKHNIPPLFSKESRVLILGSFPSVKSREAQFFYGHPQNRFWQVISHIFGFPIPQTVEQKNELILKNNLALWDVIQSCEICGSSDSSIKCVVPNDISYILKNSKVERIYLNGKTAERYFKKHIASSVDVPFCTLPSTSAANAAYSLQKLVSEWEKIK